MASRQSEVYARWTKLDQSFRLLGAGAGATVEAEGQGEAAGQLRKGTAGL
jgi:hypothetical protein